MFERDGQALYFGVTPVENIFLTELMPSAKGDFVKVYLAALFHAGQPGEDTNVQELAGELQQTPAQVEAALRYWERRGALSYIAGENPKYRLYSLTQRALTGQDTAPEADEDYIAFSENVYSLFGDERKLRPSEIAAAYEWVVDEGLSQDAVLTLLFHFKETAGAHFSFKKAGETAARMKQDGVLTAQDAESYLGFEDAVRKGAQAVLRRLGKRRLPSDEELALYRKWLREWRFTQEAVLTACRETTAAGDPSFKYLDGILSRLRQDGKPMDERRVERLLSEGDELKDRTERVLNALGSKARPASAMPVVEALCREHPEEVVLIAARECALNGAHTLDLMQKLLDSWKEKGLDSREAVEAHIQKVREQDAFLRRIYEACGADSRPGSADRARLSSWRESGYSDELILEAARQAAGASGRKTAYMAAVLTRWQEAGVRTPEDVSKLAPRGPSVQERPVKQVSAQQYAQRDYREEDLENQLGVNELFRDAPAEGSHT